MSIKGAAHASLLLLLVWGGSCHTSLWEMNCMLPAVAVHVSAQLLGAGTASSLMQQMLLRAPQAPWRPWKLPVAARGRRVLLKRRAVILQVALLPLRM